MTPNPSQRTGPWLLVFLLLVGQGLAAAPLDLVILLDASASIARADPGDERKRLADALIDRLGRHDRAMVMAFDEAIYPLTPLLPIGERGARARLRRAVAEAPANGFYSDLSGALEEAAARLRGRPERAKAIVLVSDGRMALADEANTARHTQYLLFDLVPRLARAKIRLFTADPGGRGNEALLRLLAEDGRGRHLTLDGGAPDGPARRILALARQGGIPPRDKQPLEIAPGTQNAVLTARAGDQAVVELKPPEGALQKPRPRRQDGRLYVLLEHPKAGTWTLLHRHLKDIRLYQDPTVNLQLQGGEPRVGGQLQFAAWTQERQGADELLKALPLSLTITQPDGTRLELPLNDQGQTGDLAPGDGIYGGLFIPTQPGPHALALHTRLGPYPLHSEHALEIQPPPPPPEAPQAAEGHPGPGHGEHPAPEHGEAAAPTPEHPEPAEDEQTGDQEEEAGLGLVFWLSLVWILIVLGGSGAGVWWWLKKKKGGKNKGGDDAEGEDGEAVEIAEEVETDEKDD